MSQVKLCDYGTPVKAEVNTCWNCYNKQDIIMRAGVQMVRCFGNLKPFRQGCPSWSDGKDLEHMLQYAAAKEGHITPESGH